MSDQIGHTLSRRQLLAVMTTGTLASLTGCEHDTSESAGIPVQPSPTWQANYSAHIHHEWPVMGPRASPSEDSILSTSTTLNYLGTTWEPNGNPLSVDDVNESQDDAHDEGMARHSGAWKHTFGFSSNAIALYRWNGDWIMAPSKTGSPVDIGNIFVVNGGHTDEPLEKSDFDIDQDVFIPSRERAERVAISVRRDDDLTGFFDGKSFEKRIDSLDQEIRDQIARGPANVEAVTSGVPVSNINRVRRSLERQESNTSLVFTGIGVGVTIGGTLGSFVPGIGTAVGGVLGGASGALIGLSLTGLSLIISNMPNVFGGAVPAPSVPFSEGVANASPMGHDAVGHYATFDVYSTPGAKGEFTVRAVHRHEPSDRLVGRGPEEERQVLALWKVELADLKPRSEMAEDELPPPGATKISNPDEYPARISAAYFNDKRHTVQKPDPDERFQWPDWWAVEPTPKPAIAGPISNVSKSGNQYSADGTLLSGSHLAEFEWNTYKINNTDWEAYLQELFFAIMFDREAPNLLEYLPEKRHENTFTGKFPDIAYDETGRYFLELIVKDQNRATAEEEGNVIDDHIFGVGKTAELVTVGGGSPNPKITVKRETQAKPATPTNGTANDTGTTRGGIAPPSKIPRGGASGFILSGARSTPTDQIAKYGWIVVGPLPKADVDLGSLDFELLVDLLLKTQASENLVQREAGESVSIAQAPKDDEFYFVALTIVTEVGGWATTFKPLESSGGGPSELAPREMDIYGLTGQSDSGILTVRLEGPDDADFDLYATLDGRTPKLGNYDKSSRGMGSIEELTFDVDRIYPISDVVKIGVVSRSGSGQYSLSITNRSDIGLEYLRTRQL